MENNKENVIKRFVYSSSFVVIIDCLNSINFRICIPTKFHKRWTIQNWLFLFLKRNKTRKINRFKFFSVIFLGKLNLSDVEWCHDLFQNSPVIFLIIRFIWNEKVWYQRVIYYNNNDGLWHSFRGKTPETLQIKTI